MQQKAQHKQKTKQELDNKKTLQRASFGYGTLCLSDKASLQRMLIFYF